MIRVLLVLFVFPLLAASIGNPSAPALLEEGFFIPDTSWSNLQAGFTQDFLFGKRMKTEELSIQGAHLKASTQIADVAWCVRERFNLQLELGSGQLQWRWHQEGSKIYGRSSYGLFWSGDAKLLIIEVKDTYFSIDGRAGGASGLGHGASYNFWQGGAAITQKIGLFAPYWGWSFNQTNFKVDAASFQAEVFSGPFIGCSLSNGAKGLLNVEWRGWFEQGLALMGQLRF